MLYTDEYRESNSKFDDQISKLQQCKHEMISIFKDLDNLENDISIYKYGNNKSHHSHSSYISRDYYSSSDSLSNYSECSCKKRVDDAYSSEDEIKYIRHKHYDDDEYDIDYKPPVPKSEKYRPTSKLTFSYKIPKSSYEPIQSNTKLDLDKFYRRVAVSDIKRSNSVSFDFKNNKNANFVNNHSSLSMSRPKQKTKVEKFIFKPKWIPNGKFDNSVNNKNFLSSSTTSLNRPVSGSSSSSKAEATPWKHSLKKKTDNPVYLSSTDLTKSLDNIRNSRPSKKKPAIDPKDIGGGWKPIYKSKESLDIYSEMRVEQTNPEKDKPPVKKKVFIDEKDVGKGWKSIGKIKEDGLRIYSTPSNLIEDVEKNKDVKKKKLIDEKDIGNGWKSTGKIKENDLKIYSAPPNLVEEPDKANKVITKKNLVDEKDIGKGWKPSGKIKEDIFPKSEQPDTKKPALSTENLKIEKKTVQTKDVGKGWKPFGNSQTAAKPPAPPPSTNKPPVPIMTKRSKLVKSSTITKNNLEENKSATEKFATSTPNRSFDLKVDNQELMEESIIQQAPDEPISNNNSKNKSNLSNNDKSNSSKNKSNKDEALNENINKEDDNPKLKISIEQPEDEKPKEKVEKQEEEEEEEEVFDDDDVPTEKNETKKDETKKENSDLDESIKIDKENEITEPNSKITDDISEKQNNNEIASEKNDEDEEDGKQLWNLKDDDDDDDIED